LIHLKPGGRKSGRLRGVFLALGAAAAGSTGALGLQFSGKAVTTVTTLTEADSVRYRTRTLVTSKYSEPHLAMIWINWLGIELPINFIRRRQEPRSILQRI
jgi:hypothetical protein